MYSIAGYCSAWSVKPGLPIAFMVSSVGDRPYRLRFVRLLCCDPNPAGPGYSEIHMPTVLDGITAGFERGVSLGSYGRSGSLTIEAAGLSLSATIWPTTPKKGLQGIIALACGGWTMALVVGEKGGAGIVVGTPDGKQVRIEVAQAFHARRWYDVKATLDKHGIVTVSQRPHLPLGDAGDAKAATDARVLGGTARIYVAALPPQQGSNLVSGHFNGKIEHPSAETLAASDGSAAASGTVVAQWNFSDGIQTQRVRDEGPQGADLTLVNMPSRAMTGSAWNGSVHHWETAPDHYTAIHFHDDDHGSFDWPVSFTLEVPGEWPTGFYAAHVQSESGQDYIPFFVRPRQRSSDVVFIVPTFTYQVYGSHPKPGRGEEIAERARAWGALTETPDMNPQFGLSCYSRHSDGSGSSIVSMHRPMLDTRPRQISLMDPCPEGSGTGRIAADSYIESWLLAETADHDVMTDHDLHDEGFDGLSGYRVLVTGEHPEYLSERMMEAIERFLENGGRLLYLGGNGFYWRAEPSQSEPHAIEVRRAEDGIRAWETEPGESYHAFGGGYGGLWRRIGRSSHRLVGVGFSAQGTYSGAAYRFTDGIEDPRVAFMREGLQIQAGDEFGAFSYMGGGAAGYELDSVNARYGSPPHVLVVAKGIVIRPDYVWVHEDILAERHPRPPEEWSCADLAFFETGSGGAVFSVGSMTYAGALAFDGPVRRLTTNVLARFRDPTPFALPM